MDKNISILKYLYDVQSSVKAIDLHLSSKRNYSDYTSNLTIQRAVERELEIIGEAISKLLQAEPGIPISYARWKVIIKDIPLLEEEINTLIT